MMRCLLLAILLQPGSTYVSKNTVRGGIPPRHVVSKFSPHSDGIRRGSRPLAVFIPKASVKDTQEEDPATASTNIAAATTTTSPLSLTQQVPTTRRILSIAIPSIGIWLCSPLLSMIDTGTVGLLSGTIQQAALNPAVAVSEYTARLLWFLYVGTTNLVAVSQQEDKGDDTMPQTAQVFQSSLQLSVWVGAGLGLLLLLSSRTLLKLLIGNRSLDPQVLAAASKYVGIRALGFPAAAVMGTAQAACLGLQDATSGLLVFGVAAILNLVVDLTLVRQPHPWLGGVAGAAWATVGAQYLAAWLYMKWLCHNHNNNNNKKLETINVPSVSILQQLQKKFIHKTSNNSQNSKTPSATTATSNKSTIPTRGLLANRFSIAQLLTKRPASHIVKGFQPYLLPVTTTNVGRCSTYVAMGHVVSSALGMTSMAANQIILSIFNFLIPIADSLSLTAQSLVPGIVNSSDSNTRKQRATVLWKTTLQFGKAALLLGLVQASLVATIPWAATLFTTDRAVLAMVRSIVPYLLVLFASHGIFCSAEGILLGQRDLTYLGRMYGMYFVVVPFLMMRLKWAALAGNTAITLKSTWQVFLGYQAFRISAWVGRVLWLQRKLERSNREGGENDALAAVPSS